MINNMTFNLNNAADGQSMTISLVMDETVIGHVDCGIPEIEELIANLGAARALLADPVPLQIEPRSRVVALDDPIWQTKIAYQAPKPGVVLALRHPGYGWIATLLPHARATALGQSLLDLAAQPPSPACAQ